MTSKPKDATIGKYDGRGMCMCSPSLRPRWCRWPPAPPRNPATAPGALRRPRCTCGASTRPGRGPDGISAKLYSGGGEGIDHSRVRASQGSAGAGRVLRRHDEGVVDEHQDRDGDDERADGRHHVPEAPARGSCRRCRCAGACPRRPSMCMGPNVRLKPMNVSQKCHLPSVSFSMRPKIFGNQ